MADPISKYKYVFVILVYRNYIDLEECIISIIDKVKDQKIIVVNAYYDDESMNSIKAISDKYHCSFINIENKGYSFGNNKGIEYAENHFEYDYLIVSNPDIIVNSFDDSFINNKINNSIIAPKITAANGRSQNPMSPLKLRFSDWLIYKGLVKKRKLLFISGIAINKVFRSLFMVFFKNKKKKIFAAHGSFVIFSRAVLEKFNFKPYDENMFLFAEESVIAEKAKKNGILTFYYPQISVLHKEDGSMKLANFSINNELIKSNIYFYETYIKNK